MLELWGGGSVASVGFSVNISSMSVKPNVGVSSSDIINIIAEFEDDLQGSYILKVDSEGKKCVNGAEVRPANVTEVKNCYRNLNLAHSVSISPGNFPVALEPGPLFDEFLDCDADFRVHVIAEKNICEDTRYNNAENCVRLF